MEPDEVLRHYEQCLRLIHRTVRDFIQYVGLPMSEYEELFSQAHLYFMIATQSYDGESSKFSTWLNIQLWGRLMKQLQINHRQWQLIRHHYDQWTGRKDRDHDAWQPPIVDRRFEVIDRLLDRRFLLTPDARLLLRMARRGVLDWKELNESPIIVARYVYHFLRKEKKWSRRRIHRCFKDLRKLLE